MTEEERFDALLKKPSLSVRDLDLDALADGILAHRAGLQFHENPHGQAPTATRLSWSIGWNERALQQRDL
jgi:hypothetical protein